MLVELSYHDYLTIRDDVDWLYLRKCTDLQYNKQTRSWSVSKTYIQLVESMIRKLLGAAKDAETQTEPCIVECTCSGEVNTHCTLCGLEYQMSVIRRPKNKMPLRQGIEPCKRDVGKRNLCAKEFELEGCSRCSTNLVLRIKCLHCGFEYELKKVNFPSTVYDYFNGKYH